MDKLKIKEQSDLIFNKYQLVENLYEDYAKMVGLTYISLIVLRIIYDTLEDCTQKLICEQTHMPKQSINTVIKSFLKQGFIELKEIDSDRRNKKIWLSESGKVYADKVLRKLLDAEKNALKNLTFEQRNMMIELMSMYEKGFREGIYDEN